MALLEQSTDEKCSLLHQINGVVPKGISVLDRREELRWPATASYAEQV